MKQAYTWRYGQIERVFSIDLSEICATFMLNAFHFIRDMYIKGRAIHAKSVQFRDNKNGTHRPVRAEFVQPRVTQLGRVISSNSS